MSNLVVEQHARLLRAAHRARRVAGGLGGAQVNEDLKEKE